MSHGCEQINASGEELYEWAAEIFGACVYNNNQAAALFIGFVSIFLWIFAQMPQLYENYKNKSATALSTGFLLFWTLGDSCNLIGCVLTAQPATLLYNAIYFCIVDVCLWLQYGYYTYVYKSSVVAAHDEVDKLLSANYQEYNNSGVYDTDDAVGSTSTGSATQKQAKYSLSMFVFAIGLATLSFANVGLGVSVVMGAGTTTADTMRSLMSAASTSEGGDDEGMSSTELAGLIIAWLCAALYLSSRLPQIYLNWQRKSVAGLSISLFIFAVLGNLTYFSSALLWAEEPADMLDSLPYLVGSGGTLIFDFFIFVQFRMYSSKTAEQYSTIN